MPEKKESLAYRAQLYKNYGEVFQNAPERFDVLGAIRWGRAYSYYLRGWLPGSKEACIVDLACGYGRLLYFFRELGYKQISGVDVSPDQVRRAREVVPAVFEGSVLDFLELHVGEFDLITGLDLIEHLTKDEVLRFIEGCFGALRPGGRLVLQTPNADSPFSMSIRYGDFTHEVCFNPNGLIRLLVRAGFRNATVREVGPVPLGYSSASTIRWIVWQMIRVAISIWNLAETGLTGRKVFTRNFIVSAIRHDPIALK